MSLRTLLDAMICPAPSGYDCTITVSRSSPQTPDALQIGAWFGWSLLFLAIGIGCALAFIAFGKAWAWTHSR